MQRKRSIAILIAVFGVIAIAGSALAAPSHHRELADVRRVTAQFHRVEAALAAGYELGYVNGAGVRIITGSSRIPRRGPWATTTSTRH